MIRGNNVHPRHLVILYFLYTFSFMWVSLCSKEQGQRSEFCCVWSVFSRQVMTADFHIRMMSPSLPLKWAVHFIYTQIHHLIAVIIPDSLALCFALSVFNVSVFFQYYEMRASLKTPRNSCIVSHNVIFTFQMIWLLCFSRLLDTVQTIIKTCINRFNNRDVRAFVYQRLYRGWLRNPCVIAVFCRPW